MSLDLALEKEEDTPDWCIYTFGGPSASVGRVRLHKDSGDVEILDLDASAQGPSQHFYLAHLVPRLHTYHDRSTYPDQDRWTA